MLQLFILAFEYSLNTFSTYLINVFRCDEDTYSKNDLLLLE